MHEDHRKRDLSKNAIPVAAVQVELCPRFVEGIEGGRVGGEAAVSAAAAKDSLRLLGGKVLDAFLREHSHVDLFV